MAGVSFEHVGKVYKGGTRAVQDLNLEVADGEFLVFVGPSGCGKTTALRMCAGLESITEGEIRIGDLAVNALEPRKRDIAMVFQNYALYPQMSVFENIAFPLRSRGVPRKEIRPRVESIARRLAIDELLSRKPGQLSGGQRQRVAMGRALVREPQVFLMDEPLSNLDAKLRVQMRAEIAELQRDLATTTIYVTHDQVEAMTMGTRIAVMRKGLLQQVGPPQQLYDDPANLFVAGFIGSPAMNLFRAAVVESPAGIGLQMAGASCSLPSSVADALAPFRGREIALGIRPEGVLIGTGATGSALELKAELKLIEALGFESLMHLELESEPVVSEELLEIAADVDPATVSSLSLASRRHRAPLVARAGAQERGRPGDVLDISIPVKEVHFFDLSTGGRVTTAGDAHSGAARLSSYQSQEGAP